MARVSVVGSGYVGLTTGACLAHLGHSVTCSDVDSEKVNRLNDGQISIVEDGLSKLVVDGLAANRLKFVLGAEFATNDSEFAFLCVPTPSRKDGTADLSFVEAATRQIADVLPRNAVVVNKSTVPVGSTRVVERVLRRPDTRVVSNPEFLREGTAVHDFLNPDRIVVGSDDREAALRVASLYEGIAAPVLITDAASAETIKYASNAFLATKLSFVNAIASICEEVGADVRDVMQGLGYDRRIGHEFLKPGPGWGGSCFPKDTAALLRTAELVNYDFTLLRSVIDSNVQQLDRTTTKITEGLKENDTIAIWGLTFKALTDDLRDSPSLEIISRLISLGYRIRAYDPTVKEGVKGFPSLEICETELAACAGARVLAVLTEWENFRWVDPIEVNHVMVGNRVVDARNLLDRSVWRSAGFRYVGVGF